MIEWIISKDSVDYPQAIATMQRRVDDIIKGIAPETIWLLEHPCLYSAGTSAKEIDLLHPNRFPVFKTNRGGQYTYHGPGQRVVYVMLDLKKYGRDVHKFLRMIERWIIATLTEFNLNARGCHGLTGIWVSQPADLCIGDDIVRQNKIAAIGVRVKKWISLHGFSINLNPTLEHFTGIVPCGINDYGVTSLFDLGINITMAELDTALEHKFKSIFQKNTIFHGSLKKFVESA